MSAQTVYKFGTPVGVAGGIVDLAPYAIDTFLNEENDGVMGFGLGVVDGTASGKQVKLPVAASTAIEGVTVNNLTTELGLDGKVYVRKGAAIGVMRYGRVYVKLATGATPAYGDPAYVVKSTAEFGYFTESSTGTIAVKGRFLGIIDTANGIAEVELFNQAQS